MTDVAVSDAWSRISHDGTPATSKSRTSHEPGEEP